MENPQNELQNLLAVTPGYNVPAVLLYPIDALLQADGKPVDPVLARRVQQAARKPGGKLHGPQSMVLKVSKIFGKGDSRLNQDLLVAYTKKRDFACLLRKEWNPAAFKQLLGVLEKKAVIGGQTAYFAAELTHPNYLTVNIETVLGEQPF